MLVVFLHVSETLDNWKRFSDDKDAPCSQYTADEPIRLLQANSVAQSTQALSQAYPLNTMHTCTATANGGTKQPFQSS